MVRSQDKPATPLKSGENISEGGITQYGPYGPGKASSVCSSSSWTPLECALTNMRSRTTIGTDLSYRDEPHEPGQIRTRQTVHAANKKRWNLDTDMFRQKPYEGS
jgi:hypothetical protein